MRDFHLPGRSPVYAHDGMVATSQPLATSAGLDVLRRGGTAADAAVCAAAVLSVVEPQMTGIGGDAFFLFSRGGGPAVAYSGSSRAPGAARVERFLDQGIQSIGPTSVHAVGIPGTIDAWERLAADHGRMGLDDLLQPAIRYAEDGFPVHPRVARDWATQTGKLIGDAHARRIYLPNDAAPSAGDRLGLPELAETLKKIARRGREAFYGGEVAEDMVSSLRALGGLHSLEDFETFSGEYVAPIATGYRGTDVWQCPPNTQGFVVLLILNILEGFDLGRLEPASADRLCLEIEAARLAFQERNALLADPDATDVPVERLLSKAYAQSLRARMPSHAGQSPVGARKSNTVYVCAVDRDRNVASLINSLSLFFGAGIASSRTGVLFNNRLAGFALDPDHPNVIAPNKRPRHTTVPAMAYQGGRATLTFGVTGGDFQPVGQAHVLTNMINFGMDVQDALDAPRVMLNGDLVEVERGIPRETVEDLEARGYRLKTVDAPLGSGQCIRIDWQRGLLVGGSDHRRDGCALGY